MGWSSGAGELNVGRGIGITREHFYGGPFNQFSQLEASKSMSPIIINIFVVVLQDFDENKGSAVLEREFIGSGMKQAQVFREINEIEKR